MIPYRAISFPFRFINGNVATTTTYDELVRGQVIDALMTNQGERVFRPTYGCDVIAALFDPREELARKDAAGIIQRRLEAFVPRCTVEKCVIELPPGTTRVDVVVIYKSSRYGTDVTLRVPISASEFANRALANAPTSTGEDFP
jgi:phage baseplate assembly protein W